MGTKGFVILGVVAVTLLAGLTACASKDVELLFETMARDQGFFTGEGYGREEPNLLVISQIADIDTPGLEVRFPAALADQLRVLDYDRFFAILALQGLHGSGGFQITVQRISRRGDTVFVQASFVEPGPDDFRTWGFTSPYHLVVVPKEASWRRSIRFVLMKDDRSVAETTHFIP